MTCEKIAKMISVSLFFLQCFFFKSEWLSGTEYFFSSKKVLQDYYYCLYNNVLSIYINSEEYLVKDIQNQAKRRGRWERALPGDYPERPGGGPIEILVLRRVHNVLKVT